MGAHVQIKLNMMSQAQGSRPGPPTDRNRRAFFFRMGKRLPVSITSASMVHRGAAMGAVLARSGRVPGPAPPQDGRPAVSPGTGLVGLTQLVGPGPMAVLLQCV